MTVLRVSTAAGGISEVMFSHAGVLRVFPFAICAMAVCLTLKAAKLSLPILSLSASLQCGILSPSLRRSSSFALRRTEYKAAIG